MLNLDIEIKSKKWLQENFLDLTLTENFFQKTAEFLISHTALKQYLKADYHLEISILLMSDAQIKKINHQFRKKNYPTNVLSFSSLDEKEINKIGIETIIKNKKFLFLGDIIFSYQTIKKEAFEQNKIFQNHLTHLFLHALLHLIGYDHEDEKMAEIMELKEITILKKLKIANPYHFIH
jgi:probable rRNA maturation factor